MLCRSLVLGLVLGIFANGAPSLIGLGGFNGSETLIDFNTIADTQLIDNQYTGVGASFSGPVYGLTNVGDTQLFPSNGGGVIASNWRYAFGGISPVGPMVISFSSVVTRLGFYHETNVQDALLVTLFRGATQTGSFSIPNPNGVTADFFGVQDSAGFDRVELDAEVNNNRCLAIDDVRFDATVPEPSTMFLAGASLVVLGTVRRLRRR